MDDATETTESERPSRRTLSRAEEFAIGKMIETVITKLADGTVQYAPTWDDSRVVRDSNIPGFNESHVARLRTDVFGRLNTTIPGGNPLAIAHERLKRLEMRVAALEDAAGIKRGAIQPHLDLNGNGADAR